MLDLDSVRDGGRPITFPESGDPTDSGIDTALGMRSRAPIPINTGLCTCEGDNEMLGSACGDIMLVPKGEVSDCLPGDAITEKSMDPAFGRVIVMLARVVCRAESGVADCTGTSDVLEKLLDVRAKVPRVVEPNVILDGAGVKSSALLTSLIRPVLGGTTCASTPWVGV
jgi:hypothetical protein